MFHFHFPVLIFLHVKYSGKTTLSSAKLYAGAFTLSYRPRKQLFYVPVEGVGHKPLDLMLHDRDFLGV